MLTFEANACQGQVQIVEKLQSLPFAKVEHQVATLDAQPSNATGGILVIVSGALLVRIPIYTIGLKCRDLTRFIGRGGETADELCSDLPAHAQRSGQLLHFQRRLPTGLPCRMSVEGAQKTMRVRAADTTI